jgi:hypothetical protein
MNGEKARHDGRHLRLPFSPFREHPQICLQRPNCLLFLCALHHCLHVHVIDHTPLEGSRILYAGGVHHMDTSCEKLIGDHSGTPSINGYQTGFLRIAQELIECTVY